MVEPGRVPLAARPRFIAEGVRTDAAGALGGAPALPGTRAAGMDAAKPAGATWVLVPKEAAGALAPEKAAGPRTAAGAWPGGCCAGEITVRGIGADKTGAGVLLARSALGSALIEGRFDLRVPGNLAGRTSTGGVFTPRLDP
jgi:hypothetical protein